MSDTGFGNYVFRNNLTVFEALSELDVVDLHTEVEANNALIVQTRSELQATTRLLDTTVARVNTIDAVLVDVREEVNSLTSEVNSIHMELQDVSQLATLASNAASTAQQSADAASAAASNALSEAQSARSVANNAVIVAGAASTSAGTAQQTSNSARTTADTALSRADQAIASFNTLNGTVNQLATLVAQVSNIANLAFELSNQIFAKENDLILGWGRYNNQDTLFQMRSNRTTSNIMMTNVRFTSSVRLANGSTLPYTEFWIRGPGEFGQGTYPPARVRTGQWVLYLTGGSGSAQQLFIDPFNIRDYRP